MFAGRTALDLGSGLGGLAAEMARRGAAVVAIEPGTAWRAIAAERLAQYGNSLVVGAVGEALPIASDSIDLIASPQVLEHVQHPEQVIREAFRVLKPGGQFFFSYENYLSFWEPHYRVRWLPLLPKPIGSIYLRHLGRDAKFLEDAVTYTTFPSVRRALFRAGFRCTGIDLHCRLTLPGKDKSEMESIKTDRCRARRPRLTYSDRAGLSRAHFEDCRLRTHPQASLIGRGKPAHLLVSLPSGFPGEFVCLPIERGSSIAGRRPVA